MSADRRPITWETSGLDANLPDGLATRIWARDPSAWAAGEDDPSERLGWLDLPASMPAHLDRLRSLARSVVDDGIETVVLLGMGGSSLAPEVFYRTFGAAPGHPRLIVLDATHPAQVRAVRDGIDLERTLWIVSSKSGTTVETTSLYAYFRALVDRGDRFVAITDPGTSLEDLAAKESFRDVWLNPPDIGGRYSALSFFGLVPAALIGVDIPALLGAAADAADMCHDDSPSNPGLHIGATMGELAQKGHDKLTFISSEPIASFGDWVEQLIAESTGKQGRGVVPVVDEPVGALDRYGQDRAFVHLRLDGDDSNDALVGELSERGHPTIRVDIPDRHALGSQMFLWEFATAVAGSILGINAFDQPNVEAAKRVSKELLASGADVVWDDDDPSELLRTLGSGDLAALCAFVPRTDGTATVLADARRRIVNERAVATMSGFGPRYLHSTGQLQKGGLAGVKALVILDEPDFDEAIPGSPHGFAKLVAAQAAGDAKALADAGKKVLKTTWPRFAAWAGHPDR